ncbi:MAG: hypothetical protein OXF95_08425 [Rhodobacteraceae bacterium]|nr:hypothetical protein [Paracoccaceae bacterium]
MDFDYIRDLLLECKETSDNRIYYVPEFEDRTGQHLLFLSDEGLMSKVNSICFRLTSKGDAFTEAIRDESTWQNIKAEAGDSASLETLQNIVSLRQKKPLFKREVEDFFGNKEMYNLIVLGAFWNWKENSKAKIQYSRFLETPYTSNELIDKFPYDTQAELDKLKRYPCLFMNEGIEDELAHVGEITKINRSGKLLKFEYTFFPDIKPAPNRLIFEKWHLLTFMMILSSAGNTGH